MPCEQEERQLPFPTKLAAIDIGGSAECFRLQASVYAAVVVKGNVDTDLA